MDELRTIRTLLAVAQHRSFAEAARRLGASAASVTRAVAALEDQLGTQLLVRTTRQVSLTAAGAAYAARVAPLLRAFDSLADELTAENSAERGLLRINAPMSLGLKVLPQVLTEFRARYPGIELSVTLTDAFVDIVGADFDLAIRISEPPADKSTIWRRICRVERILVAAPGSAAAGASEPADLDPGECIAFSPTGREEHWVLTRDGLRRNLRAGQRLSANSGDLLAEMVLRGAGVALLPRFIVAEALLQGRLAIVLPDWRPPDIWLTLYYPPYEKLPPRVAGFSDFFERFVTVTQPIAGVLAPPGSGADPDSGIRQPLPASHDP